MHDPSRESTAQGEAAGQDTAQSEVGVGPWQGPWPQDERLDPQLLEHGDRRNVADKYRYWSMERSSPTWMNAAMTSTSPSRTGSTT